MISDEMIDKQLWGLWARLFRHGVDRRSGGKHEVHHATGAPVSSTDLVSDAKALRGYPLAFSFVMIPRKLASGILRRRSSDALSDTGTVALSSIPESNWTREELTEVNNLEYRIKRRVHYHADRNKLFDLKGVAGMEINSTLDWGEDGMCQAVKITPDGLEHALKECPEGSKWSRNVGIEEDLGREAMADAPTWLKK